jgi:hypothetical protein
MCRGSSSALDAQVITLHPAGVRHWKRRASINMQLLAELSREGELGLQRPKLLANYKTDDRKIFSGEGFVRFVTLWLCVEIVRG